MRFFVLCTREIWFFPILTVMTFIMLLFHIPLSFGGEGLPQRCKSSLEQTRIWIRATDPKAPDDEKIKVQTAIEETSKVCRLAREAFPKNGEVLVNNAYAFFSKGDKLSGVKLIEAAADIGYPPAMVMLARYLGSGEILEKDAEAAWMMLIQTLKSEHVPSRIQAALEFMPGGVGPENPKRTKKVLKQLIGAGNAEAMVVYAMKVLGLRKAEAGSEIANEGIALLKRAARETNDGRALILLSLIHNQGTMIKRDKQRAIQYAQRAIDSGISRAFGTMGQIYQNEGNMDKAIKWFKKGAEFEDGFSQGMLGFMYSGGFGVEQDLDMAVKWWTKGRWNGDKLSASYLQVHRERLAAKKAWLEKQNEKTKETKPTK